MAEETDEIDWAGRWFELWEEDGEFSQIRLGRVVGEAEPQWFFLPHSQFDGFGAIKEMGRRLGRPVGDLPAHRTASEQVSAALPTLAQVPAVTAVWRDQDQQWKAKSPEASRPVVVAWHVLSEAETNAIVEKTRNRGVTVTDLLCSSFHEASLPLLDGTPARWRVTLSMRGDVSLASETANRSSMIDIFLPPVVTAEQIHADLRARMQRGEHRALWQVANIGKTGGKEAMREIRRRVGFSAGVISNLGVLHLPVEDERWVGCPPVQKSCPVGIGACTLKGRLSIAFQLHPSMNAAADKTDDWMHRWLSALRRD